MRNAYKFVVSLATMMVATTTANAFTCANPSVLGQTDADKAAIVVITRKIHESPWLGTQDGIMCNAPDGRGKFWHFQNGSVYWSPDSGAQTIKGLIRQRWAEMGWENSKLGYPISDEIDTYDGKAKVSKFKGGQLIWRSWTNKVSAIMTTDLMVDLPTPPGEAWVVIQANGIAQDNPNTPENEADSHQGTFAYCYDLGDAQGNTLGKPFVATADAPVIYQEENYDGPKNPGNVVVQRLGLGQYASSLHVVQNSYSATFGAGKPVLNKTPWNKRPNAQSGQTLALVGQTGTGGPHIHYCITTTPDRAAFGPFESVPFAFRDFESSTDGTNWTKVSSGRPVAGTFVRRSAQGGGTADVNLTASLMNLNYGSINGTVSTTAALQNGGTVTVTVESAWGEPLAEKTFPVGLSRTLPTFAYAFTNVPNFNGITVKAAYMGPSFSTPSTFVLGTSNTFNVPTNSAKTVDITMNAMPLMKFQLK